MNEYMYVHINVCMNGLKGYITIQNTKKIHQSLDTIFLEWLSSNNSFKGICLKYK